MSIPIGWNKPVKRYSESKFMKKTSDTTKYNRYRIVKIEIMKNQSMELLTSDTLDVFNCNLDVEVAYVYDIDEEPSYSFDMTLQTVPVMFMEKYGYRLSHNDVLNNFGNTQMCVNCSRTGTNDEELVVRQCDGKFPALGGDWYPENGRGMQNKCRRAYVCLDCSDLLEDEDGYWLCPLCMLPAKHPATVWGTSMQPRLDMVQGSIHPLTTPSSDVAVSITL
jgi:hypothetical protein